LAEIAVLRRTGAAVRITLDVNRQRERHLQELRQMARRWAEEVLLEGQPMELEPMGAQERKAIHEALSGVAGVRTYSKGRGKGRRVVIEPVAPSALPSAPGEDELPVRPTEVRPDDDQRDE
jgi:spoIIIJ-associated protein